MKKFRFHLHTYWKVYLRLFAAFFFSLILFSKLWHVYDLLAFSIMLFMLVFDLLKRNYPKTSFEALTYYLFWIIVFFSIILSTLLRYDYFKHPNDISFFHFPIKEVFIIKMIVFVVSFYRYKSIVVTKTFLSKLWLVIIFLHFTSILLNTTYGFEFLIFNLAIVSAIETLVIIFTEKRLLIYKSSILSFLWKH